MVELVFNHDDTLYLILNIIAHDPIHDYHQVGNDRWNQSNINLLKKNLRGGSETMTITRENPSPVNTIDKPKTKYSFSENSGKTIGTSIKQHITHKVFFNREARREIAENEKTMVEELFSEIRNEIMMNAFMYSYLAYVDEKSTEYYDMTIPIPVERIFYIFYNNYDTTKNTVQNKIIKIITIDFYIFARFSLKIHKFENLHQLLDCLYNFLHMDVIENAVKELYKMSGGGKYDDYMRYIIDEEDEEEEEEDEEEEEEDAEEEEEDAEEEEESDTVKDAIYYACNEMKKYLLDKGRDEDNMYSFIDDELQTSFQKKQIPLPFDTIASAIRKDKQIPRLVRGIDTEDEDKAIQKLSEKTFQIIQNAFLPQKKAKPAVVAKTKKVAQQVRAKSKSPPKPNNLLVSNFSSFIARMGLYVTGICDDNGDIAFTSDSDYTTGQIELLNNIAWEDASMLNKIDEKLIELFEDTDNKIKASHLNCFKNQKCLIDNQSNTKKEHHKFCPYSSIIDSMPSCTYHSAMQNSILESGDMEFTILSENDNDESYKGSITRKSESILKLRVRVRLPFREMNIEIAQEIDLDEKPVNILHATSVLKNTLEVFGTKKIKKNGDIWKSIFDYGVQDTDFFTEIYEQLLLKGVGDLFQEINAVAKWGAYTDMDDNTNISSYDDDGDANRIFLANDRPSATRFIFMLLSGKSGINELAMGGYSDLKLIVKRPVIVKRPDDMWGGKNTNKKRKTYRRVRKTKSRVLARKKTIKSYKKSKSKQI
jgi:hypothetical protein